MSDMTIIQLLERQRRSEQQSAPRRSRSVLRSFLLFMLALAIFTLPLAYEAGRVHTIMQHKMERE